MEEGGGVGGLDVAATSGWVGRVHLCQRVEVRRLDRRRLCPRKGRRVLAQQSDAVGRDESAVGLQEDQGGNTAHLG